MEERYSVELTSETIDNLERHAESQIEELESAMEREEDYDAIPGVRDDYALWNTILTALRNAKPVQAGAIERLAAQVQEQSYLILHLSHMQGAAEDGSEDKYFAGWNGNSDEVNAPTLAEAINAVLAAAGEGEQ